MIRNSYRVCADQDLAVSDHATNSTTPPVFVDSRRARRKLTDKRTFIGIIRRVYRRLSLMSSVSSVPSQSRSHGCDLLYGLSSRLNEPKRVSHGSSSGSCVLVYARPSRHAHQPIGTAASKAVHVLSVSMFGPRRGALSDGIRLA
jgi:hypothetical protein